MPRMLQYHIPVRYNINKFKIQICKLLPPHTRNISISSNHEPPILSGQLGMTAGVFWWFGNLYHLRVKSMWDIWREMIAC